MDKKIKVIFMGTPDFSIPTLYALYDDKDIDLLFCITKEDKAIKRGKKIKSPEVKEFCDKYNIKCFQTNNLSKDIDLIRIIKESEVDFLIVVAFGQILSKEILQMPKKASINGHASLLPKYRGPSPIQYAILNAEEETGVTTMLMDEGLDTGDILEQKKILIEKKENSESLFDKLKYETANLLIHTIKNFDNIKPEKQDEEKVVKSKIITKEDGFINLCNENAIDIERKIRAWTPWPYAYIIFNNKMLQIIDADVLFNIDLSSAKEIEKNVYILNKHLIFKTKKGFLKINILKPESKNKMRDVDFINGIRR